MKAQIQKRIAELSAEIRNYPTPIARCDLQLPALIEERDNLLQQLKKIQETSDGAVNAT